MYRVDSDKDIYADHLYQPQSDHLLSLSRRHEVGQAALLLRAGRIWDYYQKVVRNPRESYLVGELWGLIDLHDERAAGALVDLLHRRQMFYELPGFLALAGDACAIVPLLHTIIRVPDDDR
jgi:hypothetical protein